jgi:carboxypeptidase C (cathepsin A)
MVFRLCALLLAVLLVSCDGSSDGEAPASPKAASAFSATGTSPGPLTAPSGGTFVVPPSAAAPVIPAGSAAYSVRLSEVSEKPSSKSHSITLDGNVINFTATTGQLLAYGNAARPIGLPEAAISYTAYTRDDLPRHTRPVTFVFNGGPGGSAAALDLQFLGPMSYDPDAAPDKDLPLKGNVNTLLDKSDLVFVDPVGTGYSAAIWPNRNREFWGADSDAMVLRDFILRYINVNNRQSSPKYLYGVSYGGFRAPIIGRLLIESGTSQYVADATNKPVRVLTGLILNSPLLNDTTDCLIVWKSCGGNVPTYALIADYHKARRDKVDTLAVDGARVAELRAFAARFNDLYDKVFKGLVQKVPDRKDWDAYVPTADGRDFVQKLVQLTGIGTANDNPWVENPNMDVIEFAAKFDPGKGKLLLGDGREFLKAETIDPALDRSNVKLDYIKVYQAKFMGYTSPPAASYLDINGEIIGQWNYEPDIRIAMTDGTDRTLNTMPDLAFGLLSKEKPRILIQHGYYDLNTPFHKTELDLKTAGLADRPTVSSYAAGHGIDPETTGSYERVVRELRAFYDQPPGQVIAALNTANLEGANHE